MSGFEGRDLGFRVGGAVYEVSPPAPWRGSPRSPPDPALPFWALSVGVWVVGFAGEAGARQPHRPCYQCTPAVWGGVASSNSSTLPSGPYGGPQGGGGVLLGKVLLKRSLCLLVRVTKGFCWHKHGCHAFSPMEARNASSASLKLTDYPQLDSLGLRHRLDSFLTQTSPTPPIWPPRISVWDTLTSGAAATSTGWKTLVLTWAQAKARIWPWLAYVFHVRSTADLHAETVHSVGLLPASVALAFSAQ